MLRSLRVLMVSLFIVSALTPACTPGPQKKGESGAQGGAKGGAKGGSGEGPVGGSGPRPCPSNFAALDECDSLEVPLDWEAPEGETISIFYGKRRAKGEATAQLWLLQGGPGGSAEVFSEASRRGATSIYCTRRCPRSTSTCSSTGAWASRRGSAAICKRPTVRKQAPA
jgi:hypothetical protein